MTLIEVGLVDKTGKISPILLHAAARALHIQVTRDLPRFWPVHAAVSYLPDAASIPAGIWPVFLVDKLPAGEGGSHLDRHNQPYAKVIATPDSPEWTIDASHEILEMLVDPYGNRMQTGPSLKLVKGKPVDGHSQYAYLVEACDPCQGDLHAYPIHGIAVSDFITPHYYDPIATPGARYSFTGAVKHPRQVLPGGYLSWVNHRNNRWQQLLWLDPKKPPLLHDYGPAPATASLRAWVDGHMSRHAVENKTHSHRRQQNKRLMAECRAKRDEMEAIARTRGALYE
ncbi:MAG TPA: hypothetical protein VG225_03775 [Terracidiphilus sp.]|jgi:hypothetical protein|nr:hypothetical protein [Terracidiphilus sp.]